MCLYKSVTYVPFSSHFSLLPEILRNVYTKRTLAETSLFGSEVMNEGKGTRRRCPFETLQVVLVPKVFGFAETLESRARTLKALGTFHSPKDLLDSFSVFFVHRFF